MPRGKKSQQNGLTKAGELLPEVKPLSRTELRIIEAAADMDPKTLLYQHTVFCQASLPYRDPGDEVRTWERLNGNVHLEVNAGKAMHPQKKRLVEVGIPFGTKPRLILADINSEAITHQSPVIDLEKSLTRFVKRMELDPKGRNIRAVKEAFTRLCAASIRIGLIHHGRALTLDSKIMSAFEIWFPKDEHQRVLWPSTARMSQEYFDILLDHAIPLNEAHYVALSHSAMAMDVYAWLAQRLHRVHRRSSALVTWPNLHAQFGWHYDRLDNFRPRFKVALKQVKAVYQDARFDVTDEGLTLWNSPPPVKKTQVLTPHNVGNF